MGRGGGMRLREGWRGRQRQHTSAYMPVACVFVLNYIIAFYAMFVTGTGRICLL